MKYVVFASILFLAGAQAGAKSPDPAKPHAEADYSQYFVHSIRIKKPIDVASRGSTQYGGFQGRDYEVVPLKGASGAKGDRNGADEGCGLLVKRGVKEIRPSDSRYYFDRAIGEQNSLHDITYLADSFTTSENAVLGLECFFFKASGAPRFPPSELRRMLGDEVEVQLVSGRARFPSNGLPTIEITSRIPLPAIPNDPKGELNGKPANRVFIKSFQVPGDFNRMIAWSGGFPEASNGETKSVLLRDGWTVDTVDDDGGKVTALIEFKGFQSLTPEPWVHHLRDAVIESFAHEEQSWVKIKYSGIVAYAEGREILSDIKSISFVFKEGENVTFSDLRQALGRKFSIESAEAATTSVGRRDGITRMIPGKQ